MQNVGQDPSRDRILYFLIRYSHGSILSFWYQNKEIQKPKFIYIYRSTTFMKGLKWDKFFLKNKIATKLGWKPSCDRILYFHARFQKEISWASVIKTRRFKNPNSSTLVELQLSWGIQNEINSFWRAECSRNLVGQEDSWSLWLFYFSKLVLLMVV